MESQAHGEARVSQPETHTGKVGQYSTYLVEVSLGEESFTSRKRYSDFEWLRKAICTCFPGVRIPQLPRKQNKALGLLSKTGISGDAAFIEARRAGLESFLQSVLCRRELCVDSQILKKFLAAANEQDLEDLKKQIDGVSVSAKYQKYAQIFEEFKEPTIAPEEDRIAQTRQFLSAQTEHLWDLMNGFKEVVDAQQAVTKAVSQAETALTAVSHAESGNLDSPARGELLTGLRHQRDSMQAFPAMHYDLLLMATEREALDAEAMLEALDSVDVLRKDLEEAKRKLETLATTITNVLAGGEIPSSGTGVARMFGMAAPKDRDAWVANKRKEQEQMQKDAIAMGDFLILARNVLVCREIDRYTEGRKGEHRRIKDAFEDLSIKSAQRMLSAWGGSVGQLPSSSPVSMPPASQGYPAVPPSAEVEWE